MTTKPTTNNKISKYGYLRVKAVSPLMEIGNVSYNVTEMISEIKKAVVEQVSIVVFPELGLTGYTCDDLFHQSYLLNNARKGLSRLVEETKYMDMLIAVGMPYQMPDGRLYNTAVMLHKGKILGMTLKKYLPNYNEFYDMRYFASGIDRSYQLEFEGQKFEAGNQLYQVNDSRGKNLCTIGIEICEDLWSVTSPSVDQALLGANIILNLSASNQLISKSEYRKGLLSSQSSRLNCVYIYVSSGPNESSKDTVFSGDSFVYENGSLLAEGERLVLDKTSGCSADVDLNKIAKERRQNTTFSTCRPKEQYKIVEVIHNPEAIELKRVYAKNPFVPSDPKEMEKRAEEILDIQSTGLARTMKGSKVNKLILGLSGGLDSALAAIVGVKACIKLGLPTTNLITVSMPCFGTSDRTRKQAKDLGEALGTTFMEIDITESVKQHLKDINHQDGVYDAAYENSQARTRTKTLFTAGNMHKALVVGTGDLTELSQGFLTVNGDQVAAQGVNNSVPKSLVRWLVAYEANKNKKLTDVLNRIIKTKISPELLPTKDGADNEQSSEGILGDYGLLDFCIYHQVRNGYTKNKIKFLLKHTYRNDSSFSENELDHVVDMYFKRFYMFQFKRTLAPAGIKVGSVSFSPRSDWRMPDTSEYEDSDDE